MSNMQIEDVIARMRAIDEELPAHDGVAIFNRMYLSVTEQVLGAISSGQAFQNPEFMAALDVQFANLFFEAYDAPDDDKPKAWAALFEHRHRRMFEVQFAVSGMNTHIEHDLPVAVIRTCEELGLTPHDDGVRRDYELVNHLLGEMEASVRRSFLDEVGTEIDDRVGAVVHLVSAWTIDKARDFAWVTTHTMWALRESQTLLRMFETSLMQTVGMTSRLLLTSV